MPELQDLFKEKIIFVKERCLLNRNCRVSCSNCVEICPAASIKIKEGEISFKETDCEHCGACRAVCPSEAFTVNNLSFLNELCNLGEKELSIGCTLNAENRQDFNVGCYALLTEGEILYLLSKKDYITFSVTNCQTCRYSKGYDSFTGALNLIGDLLISKEKLLVCNHHRIDEGVSRRQFFKWFKQKAMKAFTAALPLTESEVDSPRAWRRETFLAGLKNISVDLSKKMFIRKLEVRSSCSGCGGCVGICPFYAFRFDDGKLSWEAKNCLNCGLCIKSCPEKALYKGEAVLMEEFWQAATLKEFPGKRCITCGTYLQADTEHCEKCQSKSITLEKNFDQCLESIF